MAVEGSVSGSFGGFRPAIIEFLDQLAKNNNREWFQDNKTRYERQVVEPVLSLVWAMKPRLGMISPHFLVDARKTGGSMMRIYRDIRFSKDKTPYKTHVAVRFTHEMAKKTTTPGFYLHFSPSGLFFGVGSWHPDSRALARIRQRIDSHPDQWLQARDDARFRSLYELGGEGLIRAPKGYPQDHPLVEDLKRKDFVGYRERPLEELFGSDFADRLAELFGASAPFMRFLCGALGVPF